VATSPVWNQPSRIASAVASGRLRYPLITIAPRTHSSPGSRWHLVVVLVDELGLQVGTTRPHDDGLAT
jgi:hypothetical protein